MSNKKENILNEEEQKLLDDIEKGLFEDAPLTEETKEKLSLYAKYTKSLKEKKPITIRFNIEDLAAIKARAKEVGVGYQNIIQALVHNYVKGKIKLEL